MSTMELLRGVHDDPRKIAVVDGGRAVTYGEIEALSEDVRRSVELAGFARKVVGVPADRTIDFIARMLGVWSAGAIPAILGGWHHDRARAALAAAGAVATFSPSPVLTELKPVRPGASESGTRPGGEFLGRASHILFTSGTTGRPKGIIVGRSVFETACRAFFEEMQVGESDRVAFLSRPGHDPSLRELVTPWFAGSTLAVPVPGMAADPDGVAAWVTRNSITVLQGSPVFLQLLAESTNRPLECLRLVCSVGARLTPAALVSIARFAPRAVVANCYGASETPQVVCAHKMPPGQSVASGSPVPIGRPLGHARVRIAPAEIPDGDRGGEGVLQVEVSACALAYTDGSPLGVPDRDGRSWYSTGDIVRRLPDGVLCFVRRGDSQVQVNGIRVDLDEIGAAARQVSGVLDSSASLIEDERGFGAVRLTVVRRPEAMAVDADAVGVALRSCLDPAVVPSVIDVRDSSSIGGSSGDSGPVLQIEDRDSLLAALQACAQTTLGGGRINESVGFFDVGFTSMTLMRFVAEIALRLELDVSPVAVFRHPTLSALADHLGGKMGIHDQGGRS